MATFNINQFQSTLAKAGKKEAWSEDSLNPKLQEFITELRGMGIKVVVAEGNKKQDGSPSRNQCLINGVFLGYYKGGWGEHPWQVGPNRDCCEREVALSLFAGKDVEAAAFSKTARNYAELEEMKAKEEAAAKAVKVPLASIQSPVVEAPKAAPAIDATAITVAALQAGKTTEEVLAIIAALKA